MNPFEARVQMLNDCEVRTGRYVLYWMQQSQRAECNPALEYAIDRANWLKKHVLVVFGLTDRYPEANLRHYVFMLQGLRETRLALQEKGIPMIVVKKAPVEAVLSYASNACLVVCDRGYLKHQKEWRRELARNAGCRVVQVESDVIVPVETASDKLEYAARTIRPKITASLNSFLKRTAAKKVVIRNEKFRDEGIDISDIESVLRSLKLDRSVLPVDRFHSGGTSQAKKRLRTFVKDSLDRYTENRNQPQTDIVSYMGMYLHFGQISPVYVAMQIQASDKPKHEKDAFLEELIVRRELAINFVHYHPDYDSYRCVPDWARRTLADHRQDRREYLYSGQQLEQAQTHDPYWNAAMQEMVYTGYMHNYMRMYWGKKIVEWTPTPEKAYQTILYLNNKYFLDGRDPNSYGGIAWIFGRHDRPWKERTVFGKIRYMAASGLERKCDIQGYVDKVEARRLKATAGDMDLELTVKAKGLNIK